MRIRFATLALALACLLSAPGCFFKTKLHYAGGSSSGKPSQFTAHYRLLGCMDENNKLVLLPQASIDYYLTDTAFYEVSGDGEGVKVTNQWKDAEGQYFFYRETNLNQNGSLYFVPNDPSGVHLHLRYRGGTYQVKEVDGTSRPEGGSPQGCVLQKIA